LREVEPLFGKMHIQLQSFVWFLRDSDLVSFINGQVISFRE